MRGRCEIFTRLHAAQLTEGRSFNFPVTQVELADATGLSPVHVNRTLQEMRTVGLISLQRGLVVINDWEELKRSGDFDPTYLHLKRAA